MLALASAAFVMGQQGPPQGPPQQQGADAQQDQQQDNDQDPTRGVARISVIAGEVSVRRGDSGEMVAAALNAPLQVQDRLITGANARAEIQLDFANFVRLGPNTEIRMAQLEDGRFQIQVAGGNITFRMLRDSDAQIELSTPNVAVHPLSRGAYRVAVMQDGLTEIMIRSGEADVYTQNGSEKVRSGQMMLVRGGADNPEFQTLAARPGDEWDRWNDARDRELMTSKSTQYVPRDVYGVEDLDHYGKWDNDPQYGNVWVPQATADWAPYRNGRWAWQDYYGWTWVSHDPWGWAPYHWGSWYQRPGVGWCWFPGAAYGRHYWRPAVVGFFGWGGGSGNGFGFGHVGWVPLAPYERFHAWYGRGIYAGYRNGGFGGHTTIVGNANVYGSYRNARIGNGITSMDSGRFGRAGVDNRSYARASQTDLRSAGLVRGQLPVSPDHSSTRFADREVRGSQLSRSSDNARFVSRSQPSQTSRVSFDQQQRGFENGVRQGNFNRPATASSPSGGGWRSVNEQPRGTSGFASPNGYLNRSAAPSGPASGNGWRRFDGAGSSPQGGSPNTGRGWNGSQNPSGSQPVRINPQIVRERPQGNYSGGGYSAPRQSAPSYSAPRQSAPSYSAPRQSGPSYSAPRHSAPSYSAPRPASGGGGGSAPRPSGGGGGGGGSRPSSSSGSSRGHR